MGTEKMSRVYIKTLNKIYIRIPYGEIQIGLISHSVHVWFKKKLYKVKNHNFDLARKKGYWNI